LELDEYVTLRENSFAVFCDTDKIHVFERAANGQEKRLKSRQSKLRNIRQSKKFTASNLPPRHFRSFLALKPERLEQVQMACEREPSSQSRSRHPRNSRERLMSCDT
jgi:hypothetical protein